LSIKYIEISGYWGKSASAKAHIPNLILLPETQRPAPHPGD
jgi:hypothetical protein